MFCRVICPSTWVAEVISFNSLVSACEKGQQWQVALSLFSLIQQETFVRPGCGSVVTFLVWKISKRCQEQLNPNVITYSAAISACEQAGKGAIAFPADRCTANEQLWGTDYINENPENPWKSPSNMEMGRWIGFQFILEVDWELDTFLLHQPEMSHSRDI